MLGAGSIGKTRVAEREPPRCGRLRHTPPPDLEAARNRAWGGADAAAMPHDIHFLERLSRLHDADVEVALTLYRDRDLLAHILRRITLPEGVTRFRISLRDPELGPFVLVERSGAFVTCLARGMRADGLHLVTREELDRAMATVDRAREIVGRIEALVARGEALSAERMVRAMESGPCFAREDAEMLAAMQPLVCVDLMLIAERVTFRARHQLTRLAHVDWKRMRSSDEEIVRSFERNVWKAAHLSFVLGTDEARGIADELDRQGDGTASMLRLLLPTTSWGTMAHAARALWASARLGERGLEEVDTMLPLESSTLPARLARELTIAAIGAREPRLRERARRALRRRVAPDASAVVHRIDEHVRELRALALDPIVLDRPHEAERLARESVREAVHQLGGTPGRPFPATYAAPEDVPADVALAFLASGVAPWTSDDPWYVLLGHALPWIVRARPTDLYLPRAWAEAVLPRELPMPLLEAWLAPLVPHQLAWLGNRPETRSAAKTRRNDACACGSGRKHKRCCGAPRVARMAA